MQTISTWADLQAAIQTHPAQKSLLAHAQRLGDFSDQPLSELCQFIILESGDHLDELERKLSQPLDPPPWEYVDHTDGWYELVLVVSDDGFGFVVLVEDRPDQSETVLNYCRALVG